MTPKELSDWGTYIFTSLKHSIPSLALGAFLTYMLFNNFVLEGKNNEISNLNASLDVEKGQQHVLKERIKLLGDRSSFLDVQLKYKPEIEKRELKELREKYSRLTNENDELNKIRDKLSTENKNNINAAQLQIWNDKLIKEKEALLERINEYEGQIIIANETINQGNTWVGFGGKIVIGLNTLSYTGDSGNTATITAAGININKKKILAGDTFQFQISNFKYVLIIESVRYVGSTIKISIYRI